MHSEFLFKRPTGAWGRALRDYRLRLFLAQENGPVALVLAEAAVNTSRWVKGKIYTVHQGMSAKDTKPGTYQLRMELIDPASGRHVALPLGNVSPGAYKVGPISIF